MSRLYGRVEDVNSISDYLIENYNKKYIKDDTEISGDELLDSTNCVIKYLDKDFVSYINRCDIKVFWNRHIKDTEYSGVGEEYNSIFFPTKKMKEEYRLDLMYFIGDLLRRRRLDYMSDQYDVRCQYSEVLPLLMEYLYLKENNKEEIFSEKNITDLRLDAPYFKKIYNKHQKYPKLYPDDYLLRNTLLYLVPLSSMDAVLQLIDKHKDDKDEIRYLIFELVQNENHNREEIICNRDIQTYGFKRLRKEIDLRK